MNIHALTCTALAALACAASPAQAQTVYRCGNTYGQVPCPGGTAIDASDPRTPEQKAQTDAAARNSAAIALRLEKERIALERPRFAPGTTKTPSARTAARPTRAGAGAEPASGTKKPKGKTAPEYFTAAAAPDGKKPEPANSPAAGAAGKP